jgi:hypothetical protein
MPDLLPWLIGTALVALIGLLHSGNAQPGPQPVDRPHPPRRWLTCDLPLELIAG